MAEQRSKHDVAETTKFGGTPDLGDKALAVFAFAAYHQLESGQSVKSVVREDGRGHQADESAVDELRSAGLVEIDGNDIVFTPEGLGLLERAVAGLKAAIRR